MPNRAFYHFEANNLHIELDHVGKNPLNNGYKKQGIQLRIISLVTYTNNFTYTSVAFLPYIRKIRIG